MTRARYLGDVVYPYGNTARAEIMEVKHYPRDYKGYRVRFLEDNVARFGAKEIVIFPAGHELWIRPSMAYSKPRKPYS